MRIAKPAFRVGRSHEAAFSPDGTTLAVVGRDVVVWDTRACKRRFSVRLLSNPSFVAFAPDGSALAIKNTTGECVTADPGSGDPLARWTPPASDEGTAMHYVTHDRLLDASWAGALRLRETTRLTPVQEWNYPGYMLADLCSTPDGRHIAVRVTAPFGHPDHVRGGDHVLVGASADRLARVARSWNRLSHVALCSTHDGVVRPWEHILAGVQAAAPTPDA